MGPRWLTAALVCSLVAGGGLSAVAQQLSVHHQLAVRLDPPRGAIDATDHIRLHATGPSSFRLAHGLSVSQLAVDGVAVATASEGNRWVVNITVGDVHDVTVRYGGVIKAAADAGDAALLIDPAGTFLTGDGWYPTFDADVLSYELTVEVPAGELAVAPGNLRAEQTTPRGYTARFASEGPMEQIALFAGPYRIDERRHHGRRLRSYFHPDIADLTATYLGKTAQYLDLYEGWIGAYPYSGFDIIAGEQPLGLGFPGLTYIGATVLRLPFIPDTSLGHEILHSWWGNAVMVDTSRGNWAEGLTTFMADYTYAERQSAAQARDMRMRWMREYAALPPGQQQPLTAFRNRRHSASQVLGYHKAAMLFLMLRDELGRDAFDRGIRRFWQHNRFRQASWDDLQRAFETVRRGAESSRGGAAAKRPAATASLAPFFTQWLERTGAPQLELRDAAVRHRAGGFTLAFVVAQTEPAYRLRLPIVIRNGRQSRTATVLLDAPSRRYEIRTAQRPQQVCVDPDFRLFRRPQPEEMAPILRGVVFDSAAPAVIAAAGAQADAAARQVALRLLERAPQFGDADALRSASPVLLVGTDMEVEAALARAGIDPAPVHIAGQGTARAWAVQRPGTGPLVVVGGRDAAALNAIAGALPHYGGESFVVFDGRRAVDRGVWPEERSPLCADLDAAAAP